VKNKSAEATTSFEFDCYLAYNVDTNVPMLTWRRDHEPEFIQCVDASIEMS